MKSLLTGVVVLTLSSSLTVAEEQTVTLTIDKMTCAICPITVTKAIEKVNGVRQISVDYETKQATVRYDDALASWEKVAEASTNAGYPAYRLK